MKDFIDEITSKVFVVKSEIRSAAIAAKENTNNLLAQNNNICK